MAARKRVGSVPLFQIQAENGAWAERNFGKRRTIRVPMALLGLVEEFGELCHAVLKRAQGIRGTRAEHDAAEKDAVADIVIFLCDYCNVRGIDLEAMVVETWERVRQRDWKKNRKTGT